MAGSINAIGLGAAADLEAQISAPAPTIATMVRIGTSRRPAAAGGTTSGAARVTSSVENGGGDTRATHSMSTVVVTMRRTLDTRRGAGNSPVDNGVRRECQVATVRS